VTLQTKLQRQKEGRKEEEEKWEKNRKRKKNENGDRPPTSFGLKVALTIIIVIKGIYFQ